MKNFISDVFDKLSAAFNGGSTKKPEKRKPRTSEEVLSHMGHLKKDREKSGRGDVKIHMPKTKSPTVDMRAKPTLPNDKELAGTFTMEDKITVGNCLNYKLAHEVWDNIITSMVKSLTDIQNEKITTFSITNAHQYKFYGEFFYREMNVYDNIWVKLFAEYIQGIRKLLSIKLVKDIAVFKVLSVDGVSDDNFKTIAKLCRDIYNDGFEIISIINDHDVFVKEFNRVKNRDCTDSDYVKLLQVEYDKLRIDLSIISRTSNFTTNLVYDK